MYKISYQRFKRFLSQSEITYQDGDYTYKHDIEKFSEVVEGKKPTTSSFHSQTETEIYSIAIDILFNKSEQSELINLNLNEDAKNIFSSKIQMAQFLVFDYVNSTNKKHLLEHIEKEKFSEIVFETNPNNEVFKKTLLKNSQPYTSAIYNYSLTENIDLNFIKSESSSVNLSVDHIDYNDKELVIKIIEKYPDKISLILENIRPKMFNDEQVIEAILTNAGSHLFDDFTKGTSKGYLFSYKDSEGNNIFPLLGDVTNKMAGEDAYLIKTLNSTVKTYNSSSINLVSTAIYSDFNHSKVSNRLRLTKTDEYNLREKKDFNLYSSYQKIIQTLEEKYLSKFDDATKLISGDTNITELEELSLFFQDELKYDKRFLRVLEFIIKKNDSSTSYGSKDAVKINVEKIKPEEVKDFFLNCPVLATNLLKQKNIFKFDIKNKETQILFDTLTKGDLISELINKKLDYNINHKEYNIIKCDLLENIFIFIKSNYNNKEEFITKENIKDIISDHELTNLEIFNYNVVYHLKNLIKENSTELLDYAIEKKNIKFIKFFNIKDIFTIQDKEIIKELSTIIDYENYFTPDSKVKIPHEWLKDDEILSYIIPRKSISSFFKMRKEYEQIIFSTMEKSANLVKRNTSLLKLVPDKYKESLKFQEMIIGAFTESGFSHSKIYFNQNIWNRVEFCKKAIETNEFFKYIPDKMFSNYEFLIHVSDLVGSGKLKKNIFRFNKELHDEIKDLEDSEIKTHIKSMYNQQRLSVGLNSGEKESTQLLKKIKI